MPDIKATQGVFMNNLRALNKEKKLRLPKQTGATSFSGFDTSYYGDGTNLPLSHAKTDSNGNIVMVCAFQGNALEFKIRNIDKALDLNKIVSFLNSHQGKLLSSVYIIDFDV